MYHKDLLNLVFLKLENGHDMINFSEINRKCNQIFHQQIKIMTTYANEKIMTNVHNHNHKHGICRWWHKNGQLWSEDNYLHGKQHGIQRAWYKNGELIYTKNYYHGKKIEK